MASFKAFIFVCIVFMAAKPRTTEAEDFNCQCGLFKRPTPEKTSEIPILIKNPDLEFPCTPEGKEECSSKCRELARKHEPQGAKIVCDILSDVANFKPEVYYMSCDENQWVNTGLKSKLEVCCKGGSTVAC